MLAELRRNVVMFPALGSLGLREEDFAALAKQGSLRAESSSSGRQYWKLRFRFGGKQQVRYVGNNAEFVDRVRQELMRLQAKERACRRLQSLIREAKRRLRRTKQQLMSLLPSAGRCFHGREIRWRPAR
jgi:hypothetical protein